MTKDNRVKNGKPAELRPSPGKNGGTGMAVRLVLCAAFAILGFLSISQYKSLLKTPEEKFVEGKTLDELSSDYITLYEKNTALTARYVQLSGDLSSLQAVREGDAALQNIFEDEKQAALRQAGLADVSGSGITVLIKPDTAAPITSNMLIQFINEIKAADALAVSVNGQRVVPLTEIRDTVSGFSVNGTAFSYDDPITIQALGSGVDMYGALQMVGGILDKWAQSSIDVHVDIVDNLTIPALGIEQQEKMDLSAYSETDVTPAPAS